ncbi:MAG: DegT/DnrJ/EryC1/StrS family aminotransferase [Cyclobacteriaceae bacterium]|nr:DegT/DnrJ/EryC1/StrS family aminotransferase [Cyclobacteriaceae bacterium]
MDKIHMVDLLGQYRHIEEEVNDAIRQVIESTAFINGPAVKSFEQELAKYLGATHVIGCANGTDALQVALMALDLPPDAEVIVPSFNYVAAAEVVALLKYKLVFCDVDERLFTLDVEDVKRKITSKTRVVIAVHLFGQAAPMEELMALAAQRNLVIIEDNAQAIGADYIFNDGSRKKLGTIGHIGTTSFFPSKNLGCYGDGGAITTNDADLASVMRSIAGHGQSKKYFYQRVGVNSRLDTLQAAILRVKLKHLDAYIERRQQAAKVYSEKLSVLQWLKTPAHASYSSHVLHQYTIQVLAKKRDEVSAQLKAAGIPSMIYYPMALHQTPAYQPLQTSRLPVSEKLSTCVLSLPMHTELTADQVQFISDTLRAL